MLHHWSVNPNANDISCSVKYSEVIATVFCAVPRILLVHSEGTEFFHASVKNLPVPSRPVSLLVATSAELNHQWRRKGRSRTQRISETLYFYSVRIEGFPRLILLAPFPFSCAPPALRPTPSTSSHRYAVVNSCIFYPDEKEVSHRWVEIRSAGSESMGSWRKLALSLCAFSCLPFPPLCSRQRRSLLSSPD
jgi:hypothetical protein